MNGGQMNKQHSCKHTTQEVNDAKRTPLGTGQGMILAREENDTGPGERGRMRPRQRCASSDALPRRAAAAAAAIEKKERGRLRGCRGRVSFLLLSRLSDSIGTQSHIARAQGKQKIPKCI